jgi:EpsI family protein
MVCRGDAMRTLIVVVLLLATGTFVYSRSHFEAVPAALPLASFPRAVEGRQSADVPIDSRVLDVLGKGEFLQRVYFAPASPRIDLFIAYYVSQRTGATPHSPQHCLPGSGWTFSSARDVSIPLAPGKSLQLREYLIEKGDDHALVLYWYQAHGRAVTNEYKAKFHLFADAFVMNRTDGALVRVLTPQLADEPAGAAHARLAAFVQSIYPFINQYIPE